MSMLMKMIVSGTYLVFMIAQKLSFLFFLIHCIILFLQLYKFCSNSGETEDKENIQLVQEYNKSKLQLQFES